MHSNCVALQQLCLTTAVKVNQCVCVWGGGVSEKLRNAHFQGCRAAALYGEIQRDLLKERPGSVTAGIVFRFR